MDVPIKLGLQVYGVISAEDDEPNKFDNEDERLLTNLALQATLKIQDIRLQRKVRELQALNTIGGTLKHIKHRADTAAHLRTNVRHSRSE